MTPIIIYTAVFLGVAATIGALSFMLSGDREAEIEERLSVLTSGKKGSKAEAAQYKDLLAGIRSDSTGSIEKFVSRYLNLRLLFEQANVSLAVPNFLMICGGLAALGMFLPSFAAFSVALGP